jgi:aldose 1-epimerase
MVAASGDQHVVEAAGYRAVVTECGAGLRTLEHAGRPLVAGYPEDRHASAGRGQLLVPWPNRIAGGRYRFGGQDLQLPLTEVARGHASHGLVRWVAWGLLSRTDDSVRLGYRLMAQPGYPWTLDLTARYAVSPEGLEVTVTAENLASTAAPFAAGAHPYLSVGSGPVDSWELTLPGATALEVDDRKIPTGRREATGTDLDFRRPRPIGATVLDTAYTDLDRDPTGRATVTLRGPGGGVALWMDASHRWVQVYTADELPQPRASLAVEPMTAPPDAFNSGDDVLVLEPGGSLELTWGLRALD